MNSTRRWTLGVVLQILSLIVAIGGVTLAYRKAADADHRAAVVEQRTNVIAGSISQLQAQNVVAAKCLQFLALLQGAQISTGHGGGGGSGPGGGPGGAGGGINAPIVQIPKSICP